jgi:hypothetical protein
MHSRPASSEGAAEVTTRSQWSARVLFLALIDPSSMRIGQDQRHGVFELARHELRVEQGELLVQQIWSHGRVRRQSQGRGGEAVQQRFGRDILDVTEHVPVFGFRVELGRSNLNVRMARSARSCVLDPNANPPNELPRSDPTSATTLIVEAEQLGRRLDCDGSLGRLHVDLKQIVAILDKYGVPRVGVLGQRIPSRRESGDRQPPNGLVRLVAECGSRGDHSVKLTNCAS